MKIAKIGDIIRIKNFKDIDSNDPIFLCQAISKYCGKIAIVTDTITFDSVFCKLQCCRINLDDGTYLWSELSFDLITRKLKLERILR